MLNKMHVKIMECIVINELCDCEWKDRDAVDDIPVSSLVRTKSNEFIPLRQTPWIVCGSPLNLC